MKKTLFCLAAVASLIAVAADVNRKRDVIFYHYDMVPVMWPKSLPYSPSGLLEGIRDRNGKKIRLMDNLTPEAMEAAVQPDTFVYVPMGNFANLSVFVPSNEPQLQQPSPVSQHFRGLKNALPEIKKAGKGQDPISVMSDFVMKKHKKEF